MYSSRPPRRRQTAGCRDALVLTRVAFEVLLPLLLFGGAVIALVALTVILFARSWALALLPVAVAAAGVLLLVRRDRRLQRERGDSISPPEGPPQ